MTSEFFKSSPTSRLESNRKIPNNLNLETKTENRLAQPISEEDSNLKAVKQHLDLSDELDRYCLASLYLWQAAFRKDFGIVNFILQYAAERGLKLNFNFVPETEEDFSQGLPAFWYLAYYDRWDFLEFIFEYAQDTHPGLALNVAPTEGEGKGLTVLWYAASKAQWQIVEWGLVHAKKHQIKLRLNVSPAEGPQKAYPIFPFALHCEEWGVIKLLFAHAEQHGLDLAFDKKAENSFNLLISFCHVWWSIRKKLHIDSGVYNDIWPLFNTLFGKKQFKATWRTAALLDIFEVIRARSLQNYLSLDLIKKLTLFLAQNGYFDCALICIETFKNCKGFERSDKGNILKSLWPFALRNKHLMEYLKSNYAHLIPNNIALSEPSREIKLADVAKEEKLILQAIQRGEITTVKNYLCKVGSTLNGNAILRMFWNAVHYSQWDIARYVFGHVERYELASVFESILRKDPRRNAVLLHSLVQSGKWDIVRRIFTYAEECKLELKLEVGSGDLQNSIFLYWEWRFLQTIVPQWDKLLGAFESLIEGNQYDQQQLEMMLLHVLQAIHIENSIIPPKETILKMGTLFVRAKYLKCTKLYLETFSDYLRLSNEEKQDREDEEPDEIDILRVAFFFAQEAGDDDLMECLYLKYAKFFPVGKNRFSSEFERIEKKRLEKEVLEAAVNGSSTLLNLAEKCFGQGMGPNLKISQQHRDFVNRNNIGLTLFWYLAYREHWGLVSRILEHSGKYKLELNSAPQEGVLRGYTVIYWAAVRQKWDIVEKILKYSKDNQVQLELSASPQEGVNQGFNLPYLAALYGQWTIVEYILEYPEIHNYNVVLDALSLRCSEPESSLFYYAVSCKRFNIVELIFDEAENQGFGIMLDRAFENLGGNPLLPFCQRWWSIRKILNQDVQTFTHLEGSKTFEPLKTLFQQHDHILSQNQRSFVLRDLFRIIQERSLQSFILLAQIKDMMLAMIRQGNLECFKMCFETFRYSERLRDALKNGFLHEILLVILLKTRDYNFSSYLESFNPVLFKKVFFEVKQSVIHEEKKNEKENSRTPFTENNGTLFFNSAPEGKVETGSVELDPVDIAPGLTTEL